MGCGRQPALREAIVYADGKQIILADKLNAADEATGWLFGAEKNGEPVHGRAATSNDSNKSRFKWVDSLSEEAFGRILRQTSFISVPLFGAIAATYVLTFVSAVIAFVWLGIIEYVQQELKLSDEGLMRDPYRRKQVMLFPVSAIEQHRESELPQHQPLYFEAEYDPEQSEREYRVTGPYCGTHARILGYVGKDRDRGKEAWQCEWDQQNKKVHREWLEYDPYVTAEVVGKSLSPGARVTVYSVTGGVRWPRL